MSAALRHAGVLCAVAVTAGWAQSRALEMPPAPTFVCGSDQVLPSPIPMSAEAVILAGDGRLYSPCPANAHAPEHREVREATVIAQAEASPDPELQWRAAQAEARLAKNLGTLTDPMTNVAIQTACNAEIQVFDATSQPTRWQPGRLFFMLLDRNPRVKAEGAYGIGVQLMRPGLDPRIAAAAAREIRVCLSSPVVLGQPPPGPGVPIAAPPPAIGAVRALLFEALGLVRFVADADFQAAADALASETTRIDNPPELLGAAKGLEALLRQHPQFKPGAGVIGRLRQLTTYGARMTEAPSFAMDARIHRLAMMALQAAHDADAYTLGIASFDGDWQVRRLVASGLNLAEPQSAATGDRLAADPDFHVRYDLLSAVGRFAQQSHECAPILARFEDPSPLVVMRAMEVLSPACADLKDATTRLGSMADKIDQPAALDWHLASRALTAYVRLTGRPPGDVLPKHVQSQTWQVRAAAASLSVPLSNPFPAIALVTDKEPNVQTAALESLFRISNPSVVPNAIEILNTGKDYQLLRMSALVLKGVSDEQKPAASAALLNALRRLTTERKDTSRDPRVAILDRLAETLTDSGSGDLLPYVFDFDDAVCEAARKAYVGLTRQQPPPQPLTRRYPLQGRSLFPVRQAQLQLESGTVTLELRPDVAPVTVARFVALAQRGYYNNLTFHRVVPNFVIQGGSPGANEYVGDSRYMRDEVGPQGVHLRGAVGISTRGGDTGDAQIFIDLVDLPRLDRDYTVFAYVTSGMDLIDKVLEGERIVSIRIR
ncbi:MAG TPA: peptidylprolyl isomerase [Vicinamibacterales bacterium]|nr:peptidylprolyl isomerase [Vicinamibacterales bacterium]